MCDLMGVKMKCQMKLKSLILLKYCQRRYKKNIRGTSPADHWLRLRASTAGSMDSIPGQGTKIPHATRCGQRILGSLVRQISWKYLQKYCKCVANISLFSSHKF